MTNNMFLDKMKEILVTQRQALVNKAHEVVDIDDDGDETDSIQANILMEVSKRLLTRDNAKLSQIDDALKRMTDRCYGLCEDCGDSIPEKRLVINPYFLTCISCAEEREIEEKHKKRS